MTTIYFACYHSEMPRTFEGSSGQYLTVEQAIFAGEWPYDNGDDPSFYVARYHDGPLTWGVCRQDLRNAIARVGDTKQVIVVFFSFTPTPKRRVVYRLCAVATVNGTVDHRAIHRDARLVPFQHLYINGLIVPKNEGWLHDESDRRISQRHTDWLWRIADHDGRTTEEFKVQYADVYTNEWFADGGVPLARNYVLFSRKPGKTFIVPRPPRVAEATPGHYEQWSNQELHALTLGIAAEYGRGGRHLRTGNPFRPHRQIRFEMPDSEASTWRDALIRALQALP
jgi:hypothetical protein